MTKVSNDARRGTYQSAFSPWKWEIFCCTSSSILLTTIIVILARVDDRPQEEWQLPITLNSFVNTLSTLFRACLAATATEIISQQKWIWFWSIPESGRRPISHIQSFDAGSRNLLGGLKLLPIVARQYPLAMLPVLTLVASLLVSPFAQQSIRVFYKDVPSELGAALLSISRAINGGASGSGYLYHGGGDYGIWSLPTGPRISIFNAISNPTSLESSLSAECPTGNCDFPTLLASSDATHTTLGVCSICSDLTSLVEQGNFSDYRLPTFEIPTGPQSALLTVNTTSNLSWAETTMTTEHVSISRWALVNATVLTMSHLKQPAKDSQPGLPDTPVAVACSLYACLRSYMASIRDNKLSEKLLDSTPLVPDLADYTGTGVELSEKTWLSVALVDEYNRYNLSAIRSPCKIGNDVYTASNMSQAPGGVPVRLLAPDAAPDYPSTRAPEECTTRIDMLTNRVIGGVYTTFGPGACQYTPSSASELFCGDRLWLEALFNKGSATPKSLGGYFHDIAEALTVKIRYGLLRLNGTTDRVEGISLQRTAHIRIEWTWLILLIALLALDIAVLVYMVARSVRYRDREAVWKSSALPLLYYKSRFVGLEPGGLAGSAYDPLEIASTEADQFMTSEELEAVARTIKVRLRRSGWGGPAPHAGAEDDEGAGLNRREAV